MNTFFLNKRKYEIPSKWEELSREEMIRVADIIHMKVRTDVALVRIFCALTHIWRRPRLFWTVFVQMGDEARYDLLECVAWVLNQANTCTDNKIPYIRSRGSHGYLLAGPLGECRRFSIYEFIEADIAYLSFFKAENEPARMDALTKLVAIIYRERNPYFPKRYPMRPGKVSDNWNGDTRIPFNPDLVEYRMKLLSKLPIGYKYAIFMFYHACHQAWERDHPHIFKKSTEGEAGGGWGAALMSLAGGALEVDRMLKVNAMAALRDLENRIMENERLESEMTKR